MLKNQLELVDSDGNEKVHKLKKKIWAIYCSFESRKRTEQFYP